jgi:hypothetical protein
MTAKFDKAWTACGEDSITHLWLQENFPKELEAAIAAAEGNAKRKTDREYNWSGNIHTTSYEEITITVQEKTLCLHKNLEFGNAGYWRSHDRSNK